MTRSILAVFFLFLLLLLVPVSEAQLLCTPVGESVYCAGYDAKMQERAITMTPLGNEINLLTEPSPRAPITMVPPVLITPHIESRERDGLLRPESFRDDRPPFHDELLPPLPFPE